MKVESKPISLQEQNAHEPSIMRLAIWIHEHPTTVKVIQIATLILSLALLASLPFTASLLSTGVVVTLAITGSLLTIASVVSLIFLDLIAPPHHNMKHHVYKPSSCEGGQLYYEGDVPILSLNMDDPFKAGKAMGYLCGDAINRVTSRFTFGLHTLQKRPRAHQMPKMIEALKNKIPPTYYREMEGLIEGYNQWCKAQPFWRSPTKITLEDLLLFQLLPDSTHFELKNEHTGANTRAHALACTAIVDQDPKKGTILARNMDWPSLGIAGAYTLVIHRNYTNGLHSTVEVGLPGMLGPITVMNAHGLSMSMNVCTGYTNELRGLPAVFYNRACIEYCRTVDEAEAFIKKNSPLGPYHLTLADKERALSVHFYQTNDETSHVYRKKEQDKPLTTLNCCYDPQPKNHIHWSQERQREIDQFMTNRNNRSLAEALSLRYVNNHLTTHKVVMEPGELEMWMGTDNAYAGRTPLHRVNAKKVFEKR